MISTTMMRRWLSAVLWRRSIASVAMLVAVSKPKQTSVPAMSLSMVFGKVMTLMPVFWVSWRAFFCVPPPPRQTRQSSPIS
jgi:hypothetical protein